MQKMGNKGSMNLGSFELIIIPRRNAFIGKELHQKYFSKFIAPDSLIAGYLLYLMML